jgi:RND superfamily putative drug exporter
MPVRTQITLFKVVAVAEALSWAGLLVGMYLKHVAGTTEAGVHLFGPVHGGVFLAYVGLALLLARTLRWTPWVALLALVCSIPPFATAVFEVWASRTGRLAAPSDGPVREPQPVG